MSQSRSKPSGARKPAAVPKAKEVALVGGTLADGTHFEAGDELVVDAKQREALLENGIIAEEGDA
ncbi:MAG: hypothetical protein E6R04_10350 [Spirochaetes bacterium]|nr:MAG: hypothetical protein E6R04_10350 [Spirochaetota bacterium]